MPRKSVFFTDSVVDIIDDKHSFSGRLNYLAEITDHVLREECPALTTSQWCAVVDALNGHLPSYQEGWRNVLEDAWFALSESASELDEKWEVSCGDLAQDIDTMPVAAQAAILEVVRRYWRINSKIKSTHREILMEIGANINE